MPHRADPLRLDHGPKWRNYSALASMANRQSHADASLLDDEIAWRTVRGVGEFGQVMTAVGFVAPTGCVWSGRLWIASDDRRASSAS